MLVVGASGSGKTSTLRAIAGLWTVGRGRVVRHAEVRRCLSALGTPRL